MSDKKAKNIYNEGNISVTDQAQDNSRDSAKSKYDVEPLPESSRPRKDGPGGN